MTSTEFSIGMGEGRNSSKVLKPPGGGSSDIFGTQVDNDSENQKQETSTKDRLFGSDADNQTASKDDKMKSSIPVNDDAKNEAKLNKMKFVHRNPITGEVYDYSCGKNEKNGVGEHEKKDVGEHEKKDVVEHDKKDVVEHEKKEEEVPEKESVMDAGAKQPKATSIRVRQPPGGKSSGIF